MKKLNLEKLKLAAEDVLQRNQLAGIYGDSDGSGGNCEYYNCHCYNHPGAWSGCYSNWIEQLEALHRYCEDGDGVCRLG